MKDLLNIPPLSNFSERLKQQIDFILELDKLKQIRRRTLLLDQSRVENDAEHSWQLGVMAMVLMEYASPEVDLHRVLPMLLIHDLVEIDAGDTFLYEQSAYADSKKERELKAADRIFGLLPADLCENFRALWEEFEDKKTPDAIFASAIDRLQPLLHNGFTEGGTWTSENVTAELVRSRITILQEASPILAELVEAMIADAIERGYLKTDAP